MQRFTRRLVGVGLLVGTGLLAAALLAWMVSGLLDLSFRAALEWTTFVVAAAAPLLVGTTNYSIADDQAASVLGGRRRGPLRHYESVGDLTSLGVALFVSLPIVVVGLLL